MSFRGFVTNLDLYVALQKHDDLTDYLLLFSELKSSNTVPLNESSEKVLKNWCHKFCFRVKTRWNRSNRKTNEFMKNNERWLNCEIVWPSCIKENIVDRGDSSEMTSDQAMESPSKSDASTSTAKIPRKCFEDLSNRHKKRRVEEVRESYSESELLFSTESALKASGKHDEAIILKYLLENPQEVSKVMNVIKGRTEFREISTEKALALYISMRLSKWRYITLREFSLKEGCTKYPSYYSLSKEKKKCYPNSEDLSITEYSAKIKLQALLDLTVQRLIQAIKCDSSSEQQLVLHSKWGFDGASTQSVYHQQSTRSQHDLSTVFMVSLVPLKLCDAVSGNIVWENERPSSTSYCRPISFKFMKETEVNVKLELASLEAEIAEVSPTTCGSIEVTHSLFLTMIDGKIHSYISETSAAVCDICRARPTEMNMLEVVRAKEVDESLYKYGMSTLHAWIRSMECLLHIAYKIEIKSWQAKGEEMKNKVQERKQAIQNAFRSETGLLLDVVKQGSGNTNTGNCARRFFNDIDTTARITGLDIRLIRRIAVILQCISSGEKINLELFSNYCNATADLYVKLYPWYYMPSSLHKILIHGPKIIECLSVVPIGSLSEEASEARNKDFRKFRSDHTRKISGIATNEDILHHLLLSSDPLLTSIRPKVNKKEQKSSFHEVNEMLLYDHTNEIEFVDVMTTLPEVDSDSSNDDSDSEDDDDE